jgi:hypothetical protein
MPVAILATAGAIIALAGCSGSSTSAGQVTVTDTVTAPATATQTATGTGPAAAPTTAATTTTASTPACTASMLALNYQGRNGALGTMALYFAVRNTSSAPCHTYGYPGVLFLDRSGGPLPTSAKRTTHDLIGPAPIAAIVIDPGKLASFRIIATLVGSGSGCETAHGLQAIAPDDTATMRTSIPGGAFECDQVTVTPLALGGGIPPGT